MPLFVIHAHDRADCLPVRLAHYPAHRAFLDDVAAYGVRILASGPLMTEDGTGMIGSLFLLEAADITTVRTFNAADPFARVGLWADVRIDRFDLRRGRIDASGQP